MIEADQPLLPVADGRRAVVIIDTPGGPGGENGGKMIGQWDPPGMFLSMRCWKMVGTWDVMFNVFFFKLSHDASILEYRF